MFRVPERFRVVTGALASTPAMGNNGAFHLRIDKVPFKIIASDGAGWEHVSVSSKDRCPTWEEMTLIKDLFWEPEALVVQFMVPRSEHINCHPHCLHMWRAKGTNDFCKRPNPVLIGPLNK